MRFQIFTLLAAFFFSCALAINTKKAILVTYPPETPQSVVDEAMKVLRAAGGVVTHEYSLIKGFAAKASESTIESVRGLGQEFVPIIEDDIVVTVNDS